MSAKIRNKPCINFENVSFGYRDGDVLQNVNLSLFPGEYVGIVGPNGGGKTTLLKLLLGILPLQKGSMFVDPAMRIGYVPQRLSQSVFDFPATVEEVLVNSLPRGDHRKAVDCALQITDTMKYKKRLISQLSGGERQRVFIARALVLSPRILVLDEPATGVDTPSQDVFYRMIDRLHALSGMTILFVSHDLEIVARETTRCLYVNRTVTSYSCPADILQHHHHV
ncbi:MAG: ATP-binding cassette domain-containing protein [Patescibacteria group bacterium]